MLSAFLLALVLVGCPAPPSEPVGSTDDTLTLFDFSDSDAPRWNIVNDGVMGGLSKGFVSVEEGTLRFSGTLVTRGGGFTSTRARLDVDLTGYDGVELRVRGGGRTFEVEVDDGTQRGWRSVSRRAPFETTREWTWVRIPFQSLNTTVFGRRVSARTFDPSRVRQVALFIADGQDGPFELEVDEIRVYAD